MEDLSIPKTGLSRCMLLQKIKDTTSCDFLFGQINDKGNYMHYGG